MLMLRKNIFVTEKFNLASVLQIKQQVFGSFVQYTKIDKKNRLNIQISLADDSLNYIWTKSSYNISHKLLRPSQFLKKSYRNSGMVHFTEINQTHSPYSMLQDVGRKDVRCLFFSNFENLPK